MSEISLFNGDCLDLMRDLPYGTTRNKWDSLLPLEEMWNEYRRVAKKSAAMIFTAAQPFTTSLISSNLRDFRYSLVWDKVGTTGFQTAKVMPLRRHEDILLFYRSKPTYNPAMETRGALRKKGGSKTDNGCYGDLRSTESFNNTYYPTSIIQVSNASKKGLVHPTQKPVALMEYLIRTYTNPGDVVLDNCMGSGTTGVACVNTGRNFIGMEMDEGYYQIAKDRIYGALQCAYPKPCKL